MDSPTLTPVSHPTENTSLAGWFIPFDAPKIWYLRIMLVDGEVILSLVPHNGGGPVITTGPENMPAADLLREALTRLSAHHS